MCERGHACVADGASSACPASACPAVSPAWTQAIAIRNRKAKGTLPHFRDVYTSALGMAGTAELRALNADDDFFQLLGAARDLGYMEVRRAGVGQGCGPVCGPRPVLRALLCVHVPPPCIFVHDGSCVVVPSLCDCVLGGVVAVGRWRCELDGGVVLACPPVEFPRALPRASSSSHPCNRQSNTRAGGLV